MIVTDYVKELLAYVLSNTPQGTNCERWLDDNIGQGWRNRTEQPKAGEIIIEDSGEDE
jgi:hypothetical protein